MKLTLKIFDGDKELETKVLSEGAYRAGRSEFCDIILNGNNISRSHLEIRITGESAYLTNMSSSGKVKVNGERVETAELKNGDEIQVGSFRMIALHGDILGGEVPQGSGMPDVDVPAAEAPAGDVPPPPDAAPPPSEGFFGVANDGVGMDEAKAPSLKFDPVPSSGLADVKQMNVAAQQANYGSEGGAALKQDTLVEQKPVAARLVFTEGARQGEEIKLEGYEVVLGRSKKADIFVDDEKLSRKHAKIVRVGMGYRLIDMDSRNGTYVNGVRILEHPLNSFDVIEIGKTKIKFIIMDVNLSDMPRPGGLAAVGNKTYEQTKSVAMQDGVAEPVVLEFPKNPPPPSKTSYLGLPGLGGGGQKKFTKNSMLMIAGLLVVLVVVVMMPTGQPPAKPKTDTPVQTVKKQEAELPPQFPKEFSELSPDTQRAIEGRFKAALKAAEKGAFDEAYGHIRKIHEVVPFYKNSKDLQAAYYKRVQEKRADEDRKRAEKDSASELQLNLEEGVEYLATGDFDRAAEAFNNALLRDPKNQIAARGLRAAELKIRDIEKLPPERDPEKEKIKLVNELLTQAVAKLQARSYQETIDIAEKIRKIEIKGETNYLNEAKQLIDRARMAQKEEFEPFLIQAKEKFAEGDYNASRDLCEEMLKRDPAYDEAKECGIKAKKQLNKLAKEAYTHGYILESMNRIEEAKQYWNRAKNYVRPGDDYYDKVIKKLEYYQ